MRYMYLLALIFLGFSMEVSAGCAGVTNAYGRTAAQQADCAEANLEMAREQQKAIQAQSAMDKQLYWKISGPYGTAVVVPDRYEFYDLDYQGKPYRRLSGVTPVPENFFAVAMSHSFGADDLVPLSNVKSAMISITPSRRLSDGTVIPGSWVNEVLTKDGAKTRDTGFLRDSSIAYRETPDSRPVSLQNLYGTIYIYAPAKNLNERKTGLFLLSRRNVVGFSVSLIDESEAKELIAQVDAAIASNAKSAADAKSKAAAAYEDVVKKFQVTKIGSEDSCEGILDNGETLGDTTKLKCQLTTSETIALGSIKQSGWLVTNVSQTGGNGHQKVVVLVKKAR